MEKCHADPVGYAGHSAKYANRDDGTDRGTRPGTDQPGMEEPAFRHGNLPAGVQARMHLVRLEQPRLLDPVISGLLDGKPNLSTGIEQAGIKEDSKRVAG
jgi:hypothetical protein